MNNMNWGWKITIVYLLFATGIVTLVMKSRGAKMDLVVKDYYQQELAFETRLEATRNAALWSSQPGVLFKDNGILVSMPKEWITAPGKGTIDLYRPSDAAQDQSWELITDEKGRQFIPLEHFLVGVYLVRLNWEVDGKSFFSESSIYMQ
jgi:nitrogen fixation protein FixH